MKSVHFTAPNLNKRYFAKIVKVDIERLWDIVKHCDHYYKEGIAHLAENNIKHCNGEIYCINKYLECYFQQLWDKNSMDGYKWCDNPYVFVYEWQYLQIS